MIIVMEIMTLIRSWKQFAVFEVLFEMPARRCNSRTLKSDWDNLFEKLFVEFIAMVYLNNEVLLL